MNVPEPEIISSEKQKELTMLEIGQDIFGEHLLITNVKEIDENTCEMTYIFPKYEKINRNIEHVTAPQIDEAIFQSAFVMFGYLMNTKTIDLPITQEQYLRGCHRSIYRLNTVKYGIETFPGEEVCLKFTLKKLSIGGDRQPRIQVTLGIEGFSKGEMMFYVPKFLIWKQYRDEIFKGVQRILNVKKKLTKKIGHEPTVEELAQKIGMNAEEIEQILTVGEYARELKEESPAQREQRESIMRRAWNAIMALFRNTDTQP